MSIYNFRDAIEDGATVPLYYENRIPELQLINDDFSDELTSLLEEAELDEDAEGYYFHQPLTDHPLAGAWGWDPAELYEEARAAIGADDVSEATPGEASDEASGGASERARAVDGSDDLPFEPVAPDATARLGSNPPEGPVARDAWNLLRDLVGTRSLDDLLAARGEVDGLEGAAWLRDCGLIDIVETTGDDGDPVDPTDEGDDGDGDDDEPSRRGERRRRWGR